MRFHKCKLFPATRTAHKVSMHCHILSYTENLGGWGYGLATQKNIVIFKWAFLTVLARFQFIEHKNT